MDPNIIMAEHPQYQAEKANYRKFRDLYCGGERLRANAAEYLVRRHKESAEVYGERLERVFYENYAGSIVDWYGATLFRREPMLTYEGTDEAARTFFNTLTTDCDMRGTGLSDFFRQQFLETLVVGRSYLVVDFPRVEKRPENRAEEEAMGASRAYLTPFAADHMTNWSRDARGEFEWCVLRADRLIHKSGTEWAPERNWYYYDRTKYEHYRAVGKDAKPVRVDGGPHGMARLERVPVFELAVSEGLWLMNKVSSLQLEHFNKSNALSWALTMGLFAMPVVYTERDWNQLMGDSYYLQMGPNDKFGWTEPEGKVYQIALENLKRLKDEIYRVCYLLGQAGGALGDGGRMSGLSKQRDYAITQEVLRSYGDAVKDTMNRVLRSIAEAREDRLEVHVSGLDEFDIGEFTSELEDAAKLLEMGIASPTLKKQVFLKLAFKYLCDARQEVKDRIAQEIEAAS